MLEGLWQPSMSWLGTSLLLSMAEPPQAALIAHPDWINPLSCEGEKKQLHCLLSPVETPHYQPHFLLTVWGKDPSDCFLSVHIFWACFPVGRSPLAPPAVVSADSSLSFTYFPCSSAPVCRWRRRRQRPADWGSQANRHSTHWTRRIIFVEGRDRDRLSHNSPHHQYFTPSREPNKSLWLIQIIIGRVRWLAHLEALRKELQQKGLSRASYLDVMRQRSASDLPLTKSRHITLII